MYKEVYQRYIAIVFVDEIWGVLYVSVGQVKFPVQPTIAYSCPPGSIDGTTGQLYAD